MKNILAIPGSIRSNSTNHSLINAIASLMGKEAAVEPFQGVGHLPHFDPGMTDEDVPAAVTAFRSKLSAADGIIICTPEYAHGVPGSLKNAIDWTVASGEFSRKPTVLITASTDGRFGHAALLETLRVIEARNIEELNLLIPFVRTKVSGDGRITDVATLEVVKKMMGLFLETMNDVAK